MRTGRTGTVLVPVSEAEAAGRVGAGAALVGSKLELPFTDLLGVEDSDLLLFLRIACRFLGPIETTPVP